MPRLGRLTGTSSDFSVDCKFAVSYIWWEREEF